MFGAIDLLRANEASSSVGLLVGEKTVVTSKQPTPAQRTLNVAQQLLLLPLICLGPQSHWDMRLVCRCPISFVLPMWHPSSSESSPCRLSFVTELSDLGARSQWVCGILLASALVLGGFFKGVWRK